MADTRISRNVGNKDFTKSTVAIIGAGFSGTLFVCLGSQGWLAKHHIIIGLCMAIDLLKRTPCRNFVILEKGSQVGGTWFDNKYPGCACDGKRPTKSPRAPLTGAVWSTLYSFSFEQKPDWSREHPGQEEILVHIPINKHSECRLMLNLGISYRRCGEIRPLQIHPVQLSRSGSPLG